MQGKGPSEVRLFLVVERWLSRGLPLEMQVLTVVSFSKKPVLLHRPTEGLGCEGKSRRQQRWIKVKNKTKQQQNQKQKNQAVLTCPQSITKYFLPHSKTIILISYVQIPHGKERKSFLTPRSMSGRKPWRVGVRDGEEGLEFQPS